MQNKQKNDPLYVTIIAAMFAFIAIALTFTCKMVLNALVWAVKKAYSKYKSRTPKSASKKDRTKPSASELPTPEIFQGMKNLAPAKEFTLQNYR